MFHGQSVGSTAYTTGYDVWFQYRGEAEAARGYMRFACAISADFEVVWSQARPGFPGKCEFTPAVVAWAKTMAENMGTRDPIGYMFHVGDAIDMEWRKLEEEITREDRSVKHLTELLANLLHPKEVYVAYPFPRVIEGRERTGEFVSASPEQREAHREMWRRNLAKSQRRLDALHASYDERIARLKRTRAAITAWAKDRRHTERTIVGVIAAALKEPVHA